MRTFGRPVVFGLDKQDNAAVRPVAMFAAVCLWLVASGVLSAAAAVCCSLLVSMREYTKLDCPRAQSSDLPFLEEPKSASSSREAEVRLPVHRSPA